jgi:hypothetical protein
MGASADRVHGDVANVVCSPPDRADDDAAFAGQTLSFGQDGSSGAHRHERHSSRAASGDHVDCAAEEKQLVLGGAVLAMRDQDSGR